MNFSRFLSLFWINFHGNCHTLLSDQATIRKILWSSRRYFRASYLPYCPKGKKIFGVFAPLIYYLPDLPLTYFVCCDSHWNWKCWKLKILPRGPLSVIFYLPPPKIGCPGQPLVSNPVFQKFDDLTCNEILRRSYWGHRGWHFFIYHMFTFFNLYNFLNKIFSVVAASLECSACKISWQLVENFRLRNLWKSFATVNVNQNTKSCGRY